MSQWVWTVYRHLLGTSTFSYHESSSAPEERTQSEVSRCPAVTKVRRAAMVVALRAATRERETCP